MPEFVLFDAEIGLGLGCFYLPFSILLLETPLAGQLFLEGLDLVPFFLVLECHLLEQAALRLESLLLSLKCSLQL